MMLPAPSSPNARTISLPMMIIISAPVNAMMTCAWTMYSSTWIRWRYPTIAPSSAASTSFASTTGSE